jgi:hypothetical protein
VDDPSDRPFAYFDSTGNLLPKFTHTDASPRKTGLCTLLLELFDVNGVQVPCGNRGLLGPFVFVLPNPALPGTYTSALTANNVTLEGQLFFRVRVDNEDTVAQLPGVHVGALSADADCGLLHVASLSEMVSVDYVATHPHNFLSWDLTINRGHCGNVVPVLNGTSSSATNATYTNAASVLLGTTGGCSNCPAGAAFDVDLNTNASATDGYGPQTQYNRHDTRAFALLHP